MNRPMYTPNVPNSNLYHPYNNQNARNRMNNPQMNNKFMPIPASHTAVNFVPQRPVNSIPNQAVLNLAKKNVMASTSSMAPNNNYKYPNNALKTQQNVTQFDINKTQGVVLSAATQQQVAQPVNSKNSMPKVEPAIQNTEINKAMREQIVPVWSGTVERVIKWRKTYSNFALYEVIASLVSIEEQGNKPGRTYLLRDLKGPILQVFTYATDHISINDFHLGMVLRCVGKMAGPNIMHAFSIRDASEEEIANIQRLSYISDHAVNKAILRTLN